MYTQSLTTLEAVEATIAKLTPIADGYANLSPKAFEAYPEFKQHLEQLLKLLGLRQDSTLLSVKFDDYRVAAVYGPCVVASNNQLTLKIGASMLPIVLGESNFAINGEIVEMTSGMVAGQANQPQRPTCHVVISLSDDIQFHFHGIFNREVVEQYTPEDLGKLLKGLRVPFNQKLGKLIVPTQEEHQTALQLLQNWENKSNSGGHILKLGKLNAALTGINFDQNPSPLVWDILGFTFRESDKKGYNNSGLIRVKPHVSNYKDLIVEVGNKGEEKLVPLSEVTSLSMNESVGANKWEWNKLKDAPNSDLSGYIFKIVKCNRTVDHAPLIQVYTPDIIKQKIIEGTAERTLGIVSNNPQLTGSNASFKDGSAGVDADYEVSSDLPFDQMDPSDMLPIQDETAGSGDTDLNIPF